KVSEKHGIRTAMFISQFIFSTGIFFMTFIQTFEQALIILALGGLSIAGPFQFAYVQLAESVDYDELRTNTRREGIYYGTSALLSKPGLGIGQAIVAWILGATGYVEDKRVGNILEPQQQSDLAKIGIRLTLGVLPSIFMFAGLVFIYLYPLTKEATKKMKEDLAKLHVKKFGNMENLDKLR
ncbi:MAG: MFS transporter, partial [Candidatus Hodarchaeota archaeon]